MTQNKLNISQSEVLIKTLEFIDFSLVDRIELEYARLAAKEVIKKLKDTVVILNDENQENKEQMKQVWGNLLADPAISGTIKLALYDAVAKIDDENVKEFLTLLIKPFVETVAAVCDTDVHDGKQLEKIWLDFIKSKEALALLEKHLEPILKSVIKNDFAADMIINLLKLFLK